MSMNPTGIATPHYTPPSAPDAPPQASDTTPMTPAQAAELLCLSQRAEEPEMYEETLTAEEANSRIARLRRKLDG